MKKLIVALTFVGLCNLTQATDPIDTKEIIQYHTFNNHGLLISLGGVTFLVGGFATRPERYWDGNTWNNKPFYNQGPRAFAIGTGVSLTVCGLITAIANRK